MALLVDIRKRFRNFELQVSFETENVTGILGASGCGKSMTLKCIAGIETPDEGRIVLNDRVLFDSRQHIHVPVQERRIGYLFQNGALFPDMTVEQNIRAGLRDRQSGKSIIDHLLQDFQLEPLCRKYPRQLSGGQKQRVALARILAGCPEVLLLDEPFSALDSHLKWQVAQSLSEMLKTYAGDMLFVSHDQDEVQYFCQNVCVLEAGKSLPMQTVEELFGYPKTASACLLTGCRYGEGILDCAVRNRAIAALFHKPMRNRRMI